MKAGAWLSGILVLEGRVRRVVMAFDASARSVADKSNQSAAEDVE